MFLLLKLYINELLKRSFHSLLFFSERVVRGRGHSSKLDAQFSSFRV